MRIFPIFLYIFFLTTLISCHSPEQFEWKEGDILFQDGDCGDFCEAIRKVTSGYGGKDFSHNGILLKESNQWFVVEAISMGVSKTPLDEFMNRHLDSSGNPKVLVGRLKPEYQPLIPATLSHATNLLGKPYDAYFDINNDAYYCSELIHLSLQRANNGKPVFELHPMTFKDPDTNDFFGIWKVYFEKLGVAIPENEPGLNPGGMSLDPAIEIVYDYAVE